MQLFSRHYLKTVGRTLPKGYSSITVNRGNYKVEVLYKDAGGKVVDREVCRYTGTPSDPPVSYTHLDVYKRPV